MGISTLFSDPGSLFADMQAFISSKERVEGAFAQLSFLNGLMTAVAISPEFIRPGEWMPLATGPMDQFESPVEAQLALSLAGLEYNRVLDDLRGDAKSYEPYFWEDEEERIVTKDWAAGFLSGVRLRREAWKAVSEQDYELVVSMALVLQQREEVRAHVVEAGLDPDKLYDEARELAPRLVQRFFDTFGNRPVPELAAMQRATQKTGRNDPCPCGSGKKYKKCCLN
jgi:uncharacterized protein